MSDAQTAQFRRTIRLTIAYDGTDFHGWAAQKNLAIRTVQGVLHTAVEKISGGLPWELLGSSRTDAGVHAVGQVAALWTDFTIPTERIAQALNANLPEDVLVLRADEVDATFHPLRSIRRKRYRYLLHDGAQPEILLRHYAWRRGRAAERLDVDAMVEASRWLVGTHDFSALENVGSPRENSIRTIFELTVRRGLLEVEPFLPMVGTPGDWISLEVEADGFLYNMVRNIAGTLAEVGRKSRNPEWVRTVLESRDRAQAGPTAPPQGLTLLWIS